MAQLKFNFDTLRFIAFSNFICMQMISPVFFQTLSCMQPSVLPKATCNLATHRGEEDCWTVAAGVGTGAQRRRGGDPLWAPIVMETAHEVAIYIDRFHNLDLFQQG